MRIGEDTSRATEGQRFHRRSVLAGIAGSFLGLLFGQSRAAPRPVPVYDFAVAGNGYTGRRAKLMALRPGARVRLVPEPDNPFDRNAILVLGDRDGGKLGYVPRRGNRELLDLMARGTDLSAEVVDRDDDAVERLRFLRTDMASGAPRFRVMARYAT